MYMIFICPNFYKLNFVPLLYFQTGFLQYLVDFFTKYYFPILRWTYKVVYQYRDIVTLPPCFTHTSILLFFAASCGEMPSFDYINVKKKHICLYRDGVEFILTQANSQRVFPNRELYGYGEDACVITECQQELQNEFEKKGVKIIRRLHKTDYHNREFSIEDIDGRWICFGIKQA